MTSPQKHRIENSKSPNPKRQKTIHLQKHHNHSTHLDDASQVCSETAETSCSVDDEKPVGTQQPPYNNNKVTRTTFLTFPRELRQQILHQSCFLKLYEYTSSQSPRCIHIAWYGLKVTCDVWSRDMMVVDQHLKDDVEYIAERWKTWVVETGRAASRPSPRTGPKQWLGYLNAAQD